MLIFFFFCRLKLMCDWQSVQAIELAIKVCVLDLHKQTHISKPPHYRQQESCLGTGTTSVCVFVRVLACVCSWRALYSVEAHSKIWLTELARPITSPQSVQLLRPLSHLVAPTLLCSRHESTQTLVLFLQRNRHIHMCTHTRS